MKKFNKNIFDQIIGKVFQLHLNTIYSSKVLKSLFQQKVCFSNSLPIVYLLFLLSFSRLVNAQATFPGIADANYKINAMVVSNNTMYVGGLFTTIGGVKRNGFAAVDVNTGNVLPLDLKSFENSEIMDLRLWNNLLYISGTFTTTIGGTSVSNAAGYDTNTGTLTGWQYPGSPIKSNGRMLFMNGEYGYISLLTISAYNFNSRVFINTITTTTRGSNWEVRNHTLEFDGNNTYYVGGAFTTIAGVQRKGLAAINATTGAVTSFSVPNNDLFILGGNEDISNIIYYNNLLYVWGNFTRIGNAQRNYFAVLDAATGAVTTIVNNAFVRHSSSNSYYYPIIPSQIINGRYHWILDWTSSGYGMVKNVKNSINSYNLATNQVFNINMLNQNSYWDSRKEAFDFTSCTGFHAFPGAPIKINTFPLSVQTSAGINSCFSFLQLTASGDNFSNFAWNDGISGNIRNSSVAGVYTVTAVNQCGVANLPWTNSFGLQYNTVLGLDITKNPICDGDSAIVTAKAGFATYAWSTGAATPSITVKTSGTYSVTGTNICGTQTFAGVNFVANPKPAKPILSVSNNVLFTEGGYGYNWYFNGAILTGASNQFYFVVTPGRYKVRVRNNFSCVSFSDSVEIVQAAVTPTIPITASPNLAISVKEATFAGLGGINVVNVYANVAWSVQSNASWLQSSVSTGIGNGAFTLYTSANELSTARSATAIVSSGGSISHIITVLQQGQSTLSGSNTTITSVITIMGMPTSVASVQKSANFNIYPNPTSGSFTIEVNTPNLVVEVYNSIGVRLANIQNFEYAQGLYQTQATLPKGLYLLRAGGEIRKLVVE